jgi:ferredoxin-NADP reductase/MOSC domain-containing protein YiiM/ferredoxin
MSVNVGMPQDVSWRGRTVHTGVWKQAVDGPRMVRRTNVDGDGQGDLAGHGGEYRAVLVYQLDSYRHWREVLGRDDFVPGQFGENFTVDGLADDEVCIGDRYRIGEALFEVTQPRVTCYRVGLRMDEPRMPALLIAHHRPGFYLRVVQEGRVQAGDEISKVGSGPEGMTVAEIDALLYLPGHPRQDLVRALRIPALSPGWRGSLQALLDQADAGRDGAGNPGLSSVAGGPPPAWTGFRPLRVVEVEPESREVVSLRLAAPDGSPLPAAQPGQFLTLRLHADAVSAPLIRSYSLSGRPGDPEYRISVKREPHGAAGTYVHTQVRTGDTLDVAAPRGTFSLRPGTGPLLLLSAGVGVTPVLAMLHTLAAENSPREVWWLHGARNGAEHPFARESRDLLAALPHAHGHVAYSRPTAQDRPGIDYHSSGRISIDLLDDLGVPRTAEAYLCGPSGFLDGLVPGLVAHGFDPARIHTELFAAGAAVTPGIAPGSTRPPHPPPDPPGLGPTVSFARSGLTAAWSDRYGSLLEFAEACDVPTRWSCRTGVCHTCETGLLSGAVSYSPDPVEPAAAGNTLICCARPTENVALDL